MPVTVLLLGLLLDPQRLRHLGERGLKTLGDLWPYVPITFTLSVMVAISTWELPVGAMTTFLLLHRYMPLRPLITRARLQLIAAMVVMLAASYVLFLPFYLHFDAPQGGVGFKIATTSMAEFLTVFGGLLLLPALYLAGLLGTKRSFKSEQLQLLGAGVVLIVVVGLITGKAVLLLMATFVAAGIASAYSIDDPEQRAPIFLIVAGSAALLACELVYIKDPYGEKLYRMNTVFKLYLQAWFLLSIATPWCIHQLLKEKGKRTALHYGAIGATVAVIAACICYPAGVTATRLKNPFYPPSLDGNNYLPHEHPDDYAAIQWIREHVQGLPVILEASHNPYSYYARFSSNTGLPTVMGWANHEGLWRSHESAVERRRQEVVHMYNASTLEEIEPLLNQYHVKYIVAGELERKDYKPAGLQKFSGLKIAFSQGNTTIYER